jgi:hypothetical protein
VAERTYAQVFRWGVAKLVKAPDFDSGIRGFESFLPSHFPHRGRRTFVIADFSFHVVRPRTRNPRG